MLCQAFLFSGSLDIFLKRLLQMKLFLQFSYKAISNTMQHQKSH